MILRGDCRQVMAAMPDACVDAIVTDPPYGLSFMGREWDHGVPAAETWAEALRVAKPGAHLVAFGSPRLHHRLMVAIEDAGWEIRDCLMWLYGSGFPKNARVQLKPAWEPIILARKPLAGTVAANVLEHGTGALNVDGCRVGNEQTVTRRNGNSGAHGRYRRDTRKFERVNPPGRWPANLVLDEAAAALLDAQSGELTSGKMAAGTVRATPRGACYSGDMPNATAHDTIGDSGGASRFFYCAKASTDERTIGGTVDNRHPTLKPLDLMRWLVRLVTPTGGTVLDPFVGSGTTAAAARIEGFRCIGIEREAEYADVAAERERRAWEIVSDEARVHASDEALGQASLFGEGAP